MQLTVLIYFGCLQDLITCVSLFPPNHNIFMSGSRDFTIRVWDRRRERCVGECSKYLFFLPEMTTSQNEHLQLVMQKGFPWEIFCQ